jgi:hypothetical protein
MSMTDRSTHEERAAVQQRLQQLESRCERADQRYRQAARRARVQGALALAVLVAALLLSPGSRAVLAQGSASLASRVSALEAAVATLQTKTQYVSVSGGEMFIDGTNLHVRNGLGSTTTTNAKGNLILGYNALRGSGNVRTGSHCLIVGDENNYSSFGGLVVGLHNAIGADYASVSGGFQNTASNFASSVSGGTTNTASGPSSSVSGGALNIAGGGGASVSGGSENLAGGNVSSLSGGFHHSAFGPNNWAAGAFSSPL